MRLDKGWRIVRRFAFVFFTGGFAIGIFAALAARSNAQGLLMILAPACPAMWFPPHVSWAEAPVWLLFTVIPIVNSVLYAVGGAIVGALVVGLTSKPKQRNWSPQSTNAARDNPFSVFGLWAATNSISVERWTAGVCGRDQTPGKSRYRTLRDGGIGTSPVTAFIGSWRFVAKAIV